MYVRGVEFPITVFGIADARNQSCPDSWVYMVLFFDVQSSRWRSFFPHLTLPAAPRASFSNRCAPTREASITRTSQPANGLYLCHHKLYSQGYSVYELQDLFRPPSTNRLGTLRMQKTAHVWHSSPFVGRGVSLFSSAARLLCELPGCLFFPIRPMMSCSRVLPPSYTHTHTRSLSPLEQALPPIFGYT